MKLAIMQPYLFPYLGYWQLIHAVDSFVIFDDVNFINRGYINRNSIILNGKLHKFTLELRAASQNKLIKEIEVGDNGERLFKTVDQAYRKAPHFKEVIPLVEEIFLQTEKNLALFVGNSLELMTRFLKLNCRFTYSSKLEKDPHLKGQEKILAICKNLKAEDYINPIGGTELYDSLAFQKVGLNLYFIRMKEIVYRQYSDTFLPNLSIIDALMFNGPERVREFLDLFELISGPSSNPND